MKQVLACLVLGGLGCSGFAGVVDDRGHFEVVVDFAGGTIGGQVGDPLNTLIAASGEGIQEYVQVSAIGWNFGLFMQNDWWLSQMRVRLSNNSGDQYVFAPGAGDDFSGINNYSSNGLVSLVDSGDAFFVGADDTVYVEFFNPFEPNGGVFGDVDALVLDGSITIGTRVPSPGTLALLGAAAFAPRRRR